MKKSVLKRAAVLLLAMIMLLTSVPLAAALPVVDGTKITAAEAESAFNSMSKNSYIFDWVPQPSKLASGKYVMAADIVSVVTGLSFDINKKDYTAAEMKKIKKVQHPEKGYSCRYTKYSKLKSDFDRIFGKNHINPDKCIDEVLVSKSGLVVVKGSSDGYNPEDCNIYSIIATKEFGSYVKLTACCINYCYCDGSADDGFSVEPSDWIYVRGANNTLTELKGKYTKSLGKLKSTPEKDYTNFNFNDAIKSLGISKSQLTKRDFIFYKSNGKVCLWDWSVNGKVTYPPAKTYTVKFSANGGKGAPAAQKKTYGKTLAISKVRPTRKGYTFLGWGTSKSTKKVSYKPGSAYKVNGSITLYAVWKKK